MSGIAGIIHFDGMPVAPGEIEKMTDSMAYRGPDNTGHYANGPVALGLCVLRTTSESLHECQPLCNEDQSLVLVMDGRVDNWEELRRDLLSRNAILRDRSDAELVLRAYELWGCDCPQKIDGDFAFVIWDAQRRKAFCARDRLGNKPFNYYWNGKTLVFASDVSAILAIPWVPQVPNESMLAEYLAGEWYSRDETLWIGIVRLVAAHRMSIGTAGQPPERYWEPDLWQTLPFSKDQDYIEHYRELLADSVRRMSRSHRPVAIEVSGGLDSSAVFCMAEHLRRGNLLPAPGISGYTLAFTDDSAANELAYARAVAEHLDIPIREIPPSRMPLSWYADCAQADHEFPGFPNAAMFVGLRQQASMQGSCVVLTGEGGDQWLEGSRMYYAEELAQRQWAELRDSFRADIAAFGPRRAIGWLLRCGLLPLFPAGVVQAVYGLARRMRGTGIRDPAWLSPEMHQRVLERRTKARQPASPVRAAGQSQLLKALYAPFTAQVMERNERLAAQAGLELRCPLQSHRMVQCAFSTPERLRLRGDRTKRIHVQAMQGLMPRLLLERTSKAEFSSAIRPHLDGLHEILTKVLPSNRPLWLSAGGMAELYRTYQANPEAGWPLWPLWSVYGCDKVLP